MTREEAINHGKEQLEIFGGEHREFIELAIKALEQEPCEDAISRQATLEAVREVHRKHIPFLSKADLGIPFEIDATIMDMPPVQPKQRTGHWEWVQYDGNPRIGNWHCSECRSIVIECVSKEKKGGIPLYKYCPQCGAKIE